MKLDAGTPIDRYVVEDVLGRGGIATVYRVKHAILGTYHALKVLHVADAPDMAERLIHEGKLQAKLDPRVVVPVTDVLTINGSPALLMPLIQGCSLRDVLRRYQPSPEETAYLLLGIARGLEAAHAEGITHRDLKPANVLLEVRHGKLMVRVADFGIARQGQTSLNTDDAGLLGTIAYAAPEQLEDPTAVDPRADLWSFGVLAYELLVGERPFIKPHAGALLIHVLSGKYDATPLPELWRAEIASLLAVDLVDRLASIAPMRRILEGRAPDSLPFDSGLMQSLRGVMQDLTDTSTGRTAPTIIPSLPSTLAPARPDTDPEARTNLRPERTSFLGRVETLERLHRYITAGEPLITLLGLGGMGKTRLAVRYGWQHLDAWAGGVWFCDLADAKSDVGVASAIATTLNVPLGKQSPTVQLGHALAGRGRVLVILDNVEQVVEAVRPMLSAWVERAPEATFIVTSQTRLGLKAEQVMAMPPLDAASAKALFIDRAQRAKSTFTLTDQSEAAIDQLVEQLDRLPLALELAAARVRVMSPEKMLERISQRFRLLASSSGETERHRTLRAALDWSWELLKDWEKSALAQMSVFEGGFDLEAAEAVIDLSASPEAPWPVDTVQSLVDKSLVRMLVDDRFTLLTSVQAYASDKLNHLGIRNATETRHGAYYAQFGSPEALEALQRHGGLALRRTLKLELDNIVVAWERAYARADSLRAVCTAQAACAVLLNVGPLDKAFSIMTNCLTMPGITQLQTCILRAERSKICLRSGQNAIAKEDASMAITIAMQLGNRTLEGVARGRWGMACTSEDPPDAERNALLHALEVLEEVGNRYQQAVVLHNLGVREERKGNGNTATRHFRRALAIFEDVGDGDSAALTMTSLGLRERRQGNFAEAETLYREALKIYRKSDNRLWEGFGLLKLGTLYRLMDKPGQALSYYQSARKIFQDVGSPIQAMRTNYNIGDLLCHRREYEGAQRYLLEAQSTADQLYVDYSTFIQGTLAKVYARLGKETAARHAIQRAEDLLDTANRSIQVTQFLAKKALVLALIGEKDVARVTLREALTRYEAFDVPPTEILGELQDARAALGLAPDWVP